jgi:hypothetical protein
MIGTIAWTQTIQTILTAITKKRRNLLYEYR